MSQLIIVASPDAIKVEKGWQNASINHTTMNHEGRSYRLNAKHVLLYSLAERIGRVCFALLATIVTLGLALISSQISNYFSVTIKTDKTFAIPSKGEDTSEPDLPGALYPEEAESYKELALTLDPVAIRQAIDVISNHSINKAEIIKFMMWEILKLEIPSVAPGNLEAAKNEMVARCRAVQALIDSGIDLNAREIGLYIVAKDGDGLDIYGINIEAKGKKEIVCRAPSIIDSYLSILLRKILLSCDWHPLKALYTVGARSKLALFPEPAVYLPVVNVCRPLINLLLTHGAKTFDEMHGSISVFEEETATLVNRLRLELKFVQNCLPGAVDPGSPFITLPLEVTHLIGEALLDIPTDSGR